MNEMSRRMVELSTRLGDVGPRTYALRYLSDPDRAMIGVVLAADPKGARISAVTPDSPAARAGLHDGDVIVAIDGRPVRGDDPQQRLDNARELLGNLKEGDQVKIAYERGGKPKAELALAAERRTAFNWHQLIVDDGTPLLPKDFDRRVQAEIERSRAIGLSAADRQRLREAGAQAREQAERARGEFERARLDLKRAFRGMPWWGLNLAALNPDLGRYFGTDTGVLVLAADEDSLPGVRAGDVITKVGGTPVDRPEDAMRRLRDQPAGQNVTLALLRERKPVSVTVKTPEFKEIFIAPPAPPAPPALPALAAPAPPPAPEAPASPPVQAAPPAPSPPVPPKAPPTPG
jgi:membrane-associated protease RseP (regulator of RpoE activity)